MLLAGHVFFEEIGMLQAREFDGEAVIDVTDHASLRLADGDHGADCGLQIRRDRDRCA